MTVGDRHTVLITHGNELFISIGYSEGPNHLDVEGGKDLALDTVSFRGTGTLIVQALSETHIEMEAIVSVASDDWETWTVPRPVINAMAPYALKVSAGSAPEITASTPRRAGGGTVQVTVDTVRRER